MVVKQGRRIGVECILNLGVGLITLSMGIESLSPQK